LTSDFTVSFTDDDHNLMINIGLFKESQELKFTGDAVKEILKRYFLLNYRQREQLEAKLFWIQHRNKGFRSLPQFLKEQQPKKQRKPTVAPKKQTKKTKNRGVNQ